MHLDCPPPPPQKKKNYITIVAKLFLLGITVVPREIKEDGYVKFWGVNEVQ